MPTPLARVDALVTANVTPVPDAPTTTTQRFTSLEDVPLAERLTATNPDGGALNFAVLQATAYGQLTLANDGGFQYLPNAGFAGADSFTFNVGNQAGQALGLVELTIRRLTMRRVAQGDRVELDEGGSVVASVSANDFDEESDPITFELVSGVANGELLFQPDGGFSYRPAANYAGEDRFTYTASDALKISPGVGQSGRAAGQ